MRPRRIRCTNSMLIGVDDRGRSEFDTSAADGDIPRLVVDLVVVGRAQQAAILHRSLATVDPVPRVVGFGQPGRSVAAGEGAPAIPRHQRAADAYRYGALGAADVERFRI